VIKESLAHPAHQSTRELRGIALFRDHADEIRFEPADSVWLVPSQHDVTFVYEVRLGRRGESCECRDFEHRGGPCLHIHAATIARAKTTTCSCCSQRVAWRFVTEVTEDHGLLAWFVGDWLCADCIHKGRWT
jgi:SWIM zinc finger